MADASARPLAGLMVLLGVLLAGGAGCGQFDESHDEVVYDPCQTLVLTPQSDWDQAQVESVERAARMWRKAAALDLRVESSQEADDEAITVGFRDGAAMIHGHYDDREGRVTINDELGGELARAVTIAHEVGHAFGLDHVERAERRSLMNPGNLEIGVTEGDVAVLRDRWDDCADSPR